MAEDGVTPVPDGQGVPDPVLPVHEEPLQIQQEHGRTLYLAKWSTRFWAWLIDFCMVILFLNIVRGILAPFWALPYYIDFWHWEPFEIGFQSLFFFAYWTLMEGFQGRGQSIGKMVMNLRVVNRDGTKIRYESAAIESFGKAFPFLLAIDCLIGWLGMPNTKMRLFNRLSNTLVVKTDYKEPAGIVYIKEKE